jgi:hypothetical protein
MFIKFGQFFQEFPYGGSQTRFSLLSDWHLVLYTCGIPTLISDEAIERVNLDTIPRYYNLGSSIEFNYVVIFTNCLCCITQCSYVVDVNWKLKVR